jgi:integrase
MARGSVVARGEGVWRVKVYIGRDAEGRRINRTETVRGSHTDAEVVLTRLLTEKDTGAPLDPSKETVATYLTRWLDVAAKPRLRPQTHKAYERIVQNDIIPHIGSRVLKKLSPMDVQRMYSDLLAGRRGARAGDRKGRALSPRSVRYTHAVLHSALKQAVKWRLIRENVAEAVDLPKQQRQEMQTLSAAEAGRFLEHARKDRWYALWALLLGSGLRLGEALGLQWDDVDGGAVQVRRSLTWAAKGKDQPWRLQEPKTDQSRRVVALPGFVVEALKGHRIAQAKERLQIGDEYTDHGFIFATYTGTPIRPSNLLRRSFKPILTAAELPDIRIHDLRHTCATLLLAAREHPKVVQQRLGHASITLTLDLYSHAVPGMDEEAADKLEAMLGAG